MTITATVIDKKITLKNDGKVVFTGSQLITDFSRPPYKGMNVPAIAVAAIRGNDKIQWLSEPTYKIVKDAVNEYNNRDEVRLPRKRDELRNTIQDLYSKHEWAREKDYETDIGFHKSAEVEKEIEVAEKLLKEFDERHPEIKMEFDKQRAIKTERSIKSALNA